MATREIFLALLRSYGVSLEEPAQSMEVKPGLRRNCWFSQNPTAFVMFGKEYYKSVIQTPSFSF